MNGLDDLDDLVLEHQSDVRDLLSRKGWSIAVCQNKLYARTSGGFDQEESLLIVSPILKRNAITKSSHRGHAGASFGSGVAVNDRFVVFFGGLTPEGYVCSSCDVFSTEQDRLIPVPHREPWPCGRQRHAALSVPDQMFIYGGVDEKGEVLTDLWSFSVETFAWRKIECLEGPKVIAGSLCLVNQKLLLLGGYQKLSEEGKVVSKSMFMLSFNSAFNRNCLDKRVWQKCDGLPDSWELEKWTAMSFTGTENIVFGYGKTSRDPCAIVVSFTEDLSCSVLCCSWRNKVFAAVQMAQISADSFLLVPVDGTCAARLFIGRIKRSCMLFRNSKSMAPSSVQAFENLDSLQQLTNINLQNYLEKRTNQGRTMLLEAASVKSDFQVMNHLVGKKPSAKETDCFGRNVLHYVCRHGRDDVLILFKNFFGDLLLLPDIFHRTPFHYGLKHPRLLNLLLRYVRALDVETANLSLPIVVEAVRIDSWQVISNLWSGGFDLEHADENGFCPVHVAALLGHSECLNQLLKGGCLITRATKTMGGEEAPKQNVLSCAMRTNQEAFLEHLVSLLPSGFVREYMSDKIDVASVSKWNKRGSHQRMDHVLENISKMQRNISAHTVKNRQRVPFNIVLRGGNLFGSELVKAYSTLQKKGIVVLDHIARVAGIGSGVLAAFAISLGVSEEKFVTALQSFPLDPAQSGRKYSKDDIERLSELSASGLVNFLMSENSFSRSLRKDPYKFLFKFETVQIWVENFLESIGLEKNLSFSKLHDLHISSFENKYRDLYVFAYNSSKRVPFVFSWESTPDAVVADAVRASCGFPFMFEESHVRKLQGVTATRLSEDRFTEAFFKVSSPLAVFDYYEYFDFVCPGRSEKSDNQSVLNPRSLLIDITDNISDRSNDWILKSVCDLIFSKHEHLGTPIQERNRVMSIHIADSSKLDFALEKAADEFSEKFCSEKSISLSKEFLSELVRLSRVEICGPLDCLSIIGVGLSESPDMETMVSLLHAASAEDFWYLKSMLNLNVRDSSSDTLSQHLIKKRDAAGLKKLCHPALRSHVNWKLSDGLGTSFSDLVSQQPLDGETKDMLLSVHGELFGHRDSKEMTLVRQGMAAYKATAQQHEMNMVAIDVLELRLRTSVRVMAAKSGLSLPLSDPKTATDRYLNISAAVNLIYLLYPKDEDFQMDALASFVVTNTIFGLQFSLEQMELMFSKSEACAKKLMAHVLALDLLLKEGDGFRRVWLEKTSAQALLEVARTFLGSHNIRTNTDKVEIFLSEMK